MTYYCGAGPCRYRVRPATRRVRDGRDNEGVVIQRWASPPPPIGSVYRVVRDEWEFPEERTEHNPERLPERTIIEWKIIENGDFLMRFAEPKG